MTGREKWGKAVEKAGIGTRNKPVPGIHHTTDLRDAQFIEVFN